MASALRSGPALPMWDVGEVMNCPLTLARPTALARLITMVRLTPDRWPATPGGCRERWRFVPEATP
ncbi:hypothetical protein FMEAI12_7470003 [Parafrankia sp. Ea1.12]|nr:hypothetical protein FMEAI12_7470003 [Parafrankia sp. Ea1.12]